GHSASCVAPPDRCCSSSSDANNRGSVCSGASETTTCQVSPDPNTAASAGCSNCISEVVTCHLLPSAAKSESDSAGCTSGTSEVVICQFPSSPANGRSPLSSP